ncbi:MAG TPA: hypothetical protein VKP67_24070 [Xanthobacteraceae bacterium]|nr:hypothetical protein [Xanthobacteraceae bacterium]
MKTRLAFIPGLALLATLLICGGSLAFADAYEAESSALLTLAPDVNGAEGQDQLHCVFYSDGADNCIVNTPFMVVDQPSAVDEIEAAATEPAVRFFDAIPVIVAQSVTIAAPGLTSRESEEPAFTGSILATSVTESVLNLDVDTTADAAQASQSADAIAVAIVQSATIAVPGQNAEDNEEAGLTQSISEPTAPISILEVKATVLDRAE